MQRKNENSYIKKVIANIAWMIFDKVFLLLLNLLVTVKIANYYGAEVYGIHQYAVSIIAVFEILLRFVDARVVKKQYALKPAEDVVFSATVSRIFFSLFSFVIGIVFLLLYKGSRAFSIIFVVLLLNAIISELRFGMANRFEYLLKVKKIVIAGNVASTIGSILQLVAVYLNLSIVAISVIALITSIINLFILMMQYYNEFGKSVRHRLDRVMLKDIIMESIPLMISASCVTVYTRCDSIMLGSMMTTVEVGIYAISNKLVHIVQIMVAPIRESVYPKLIQLYHSDDERYEREYVRISSILTWIYIIGIMVSFIILPFAFTFLNDEYSQAFGIYKIHAIGSFFVYNTALRAGHFTLVNKGIVLTWTSFLSMFVNIILNYVFISRLGMYGAAIATVTTQCISLMLFNSFFAEGRKVLKWQLKAINPIYIIKKV